jgi:hypothetical protein
MGERQAIENPASRRNAGFSVSWSEIYSAAAFCCAESAWAAISST